MICSTDSEYSGGLPRLPSCILLNFDSFGFPFWQPTLPPLAPFHNFWFPSIPSYGVPQQWRGMNLNYLERCWSLQSRENPRYSQDNLWLYSSHLSEWLMGQWVVGVIFLSGRRPINKGKLTVTLPRWWVADMPTYAHLWQCMSLLSPRHKSIIITAWEPAQHDVVNIHALCISILMHYKHSRRRSSTDYHCIECKTF